MDAYTDPGLWHHRRRADQWPPRLRSTLRRLRRRVDNFSRTSVDHVTAAWSAPRGAARQSASSSACRSAASAIPMRCGVAPRQYISPPIISRTSSFGRRAEIRRVSGPRGAPKGPSLFGDSYLKEGQGQARRHRLLCLEPSQPPPRQKHVSSSPHSCVVFLAGPDL